MEAIKTPVIIKKSEVLEIPIEQIRAFAGQPRTNFDQEELFFLAGSIKEIGLQNPIIVKRIHDSQHQFELVDGERRLRACRMIRKQTVDAIVKEIKSNDEQFIHSVASNFCREGHTPMETGKALDKLIVHFLGTNGKDKMTRVEAIDKVALICGRSAPWVRQRISILNLCPEATEHLITKKIHLQVAIALTTLKPEYQVEFARHIVENKLEFKAALNYIRKNKTTKSTKEGTRGRKPSDEYARINRFIKRVEKEMDSITDISSGELQQMFHWRSKDETFKTILLLKDLAEDLNTLAQNIKKIFDDEQQKSRL